MALSTYETLQSLSLRERWDAPDFKKGATPHETAEFFRKIGQSEKAEAAIAGAAGTPDKVVYILTGKNVGGFKRVGETGVSYVSIDTVDSDYQTEVIKHEGIHNRHERSWGKIDIPGWENLPDEVKSSILQNVNISAGFDERDGIESLTQYATQQLVGETHSGYDRVIVPVGLTLFRHLEEKSGCSIVGGFLNMALHGNGSGKSEFARGVRTGANVIMLEEALKGQKTIFPERVAKRMNVTIEAYKKDFVVENARHAQRLVEDYLASEDLSGKNEPDLALAA